MITPNVYSHGTERTRTTTTTTTTKTINTPRHGGISVIRETPIVPSGPTLFRKKMPTINKDRRLSSINSDIDGNSLFEKNKQSKKLPNLDPMADFTMLRNIFSAIKAEHISDFAHSLELIIKFYDHREVC